MGFFKRLKKHDEPEDVLIKKESDSTAVKNQDDVLKERSRGESDYLKKEIQTNTTHLNSILQKLADVKEEYDQVVGNLMASKKEMNQKKMEIDAIKKEYSELQARLGAAKLEHNIAKSTLDELNDANMELASIRSQITQHKEEFEKLKSQPSESQLDLDKMTEKYEQVKSELAKARSEVDLARQQLQYLKDESDNKKQEIEITKKELKLLESDLSSTGRGGALKNVIEAASVVVAATNAKLQKAQQEIEVLKQAIERERTEHIKTKKLLGELEKSKNKKA
jgi:chromosome segregation ATPase